MKNRNKVLLEGNWIQKRQNCDELTNNFRKKLKLDDDNDDDTAEKDIKPLKYNLSNALVLYKEPTPPVNVDSLPKELFEKLKSNNGDLVQLKKHPIIMPKDHFIIEKILQVDDDEEEEINEQQCEMELD